jgi:hypothetical protein
MEIVAGLFIDNIEFRREYDGGPTKIDITGAYFSTRPDSYPADMTPHLVVLLRAEDESARHGLLDVTFVRMSDGSEMGRHRQPVAIAPPGNFFYQLVRPELHLDGPDIIEARCVIEQTGSSVVVPLTALA